VVLATDYLRAQRLRTAMRQELEGLLTRVDALVTPTTRTVPHPIGRPFTEVGGQPIHIFSLWVGLTVPFDLTGSPAISVPCGFSTEGLPIGLQIAGRAWDEATILRIAAAYERATPWHERHPAL
jgi:aspartyl-tRNA(Asn)/glutamyl-tRNA(Gln) amidotransferase subunit A